MPRKRRLGIVGEPGRLGGADLLFKLAKTSSAIGAELELMFEQRSSGDGVIVADAAREARKLPVFAMIRSLEARGVDAVLVPCLSSHVYLDELRTETGVPILDMIEALALHIGGHYPQARRLGFLAPGGTPLRQLLGRRFSPLAALFPDGPLDAETSLDALRAACRDLVARGAELIVPAMAEISAVSGALRDIGLPLLDPNQIYAEYALAVGPAAMAADFRLGIVGGVGPAATVDFLDKIVRNTRAACDQDHVKMIVHHNPQIPDRTANLLGDGPDPTLSLYAACRRLEEDGADAIAIPCNTAHAYVDRIQRFLTVPIVSMPGETASFIRNQGGLRTVGLLATRGTIRSRVYHDALEAAGLAVVVPDDTRQQRVTEAIYGPQGVKAGYTDGVCKRDLLLALDHLISDRGAEGVILGCTELPLLLGQRRDLPAGLRRVAVFDPTEILARRCVILAGRQVV